MACSGGKEVAEHLRYKSTPSQSSNHVLKPAHQAAIFATRGFRATPLANAIAGPMARNNSQQGVGEAWFASGRKTLGHQQLVVETSRIGGIAPPYRSQTHIEDSPTVSSSHAATACATTTAPLGAAGCNNALQRSDSYQAAARVRKTARRTRHAAHQHK